jgi:hypothetical protein
VDNSLDLRAQQKIKQAPASFTAIGLTSDKQFTIYPSVTAPVPIMRNEELILLRAEANIGLGNTAAALPDLNLIRSQSGGLAPYSGATTPAALLDELLYNKRFSLLFEGGFSWMDYRHYGKLTNLERGLPDGKFFTKMPFPRNECLSRPNSGTDLAGCQDEAGF